MAKYFCDLFIAFILVETTNCSENQKIISIKYQPDEIFDLKSFCLQLLDNSF